jgi:hypothetical protein
MKDLLTNGYQLVSDVSYHGSGLYPPMILAPVLIITKVWLVPETFYNMLSLLKPSILAL